MSWKSGSDLADSIWESVRPFVPKSKRKIVARHIVRLFESRDCDTLDECEQLVKDAELPEYERHYN